MRSIPLQRSTKEGTKVRCRGGCLLECLDAHAPPGDETPHTALIAVVPTPEKKGYAAIDTFRSQQHTYTLLYFAIPQFGYKRDEVKGRGGVGGEESTAVISSCRHVDLTY